MKRETKAESKFQSGFAMLHVYAAILAMVAVGMHIGAAIYHARRWRRAVQQPEGLASIIPFRTRQRAA